MRFSLLLRFMKPIGVWPLGFLFLLLTMGAIVTAQPALDLISVNLAVPVDERPSTSSVAAVQKALEERLTSQPTIAESERRVDVDEDSGIVATPWFTTHKGEVRLKVEIALWNRGCRVEVWQKTGWLWPTAEKTKLARRWERSLTELVTPLCIG